MDRMWRLAQLQYDDDIPGTEVSVLMADPNDLDGEETFVPVAKSEAIALAHSQGMHLISAFVTASDDPSPFCHIGKLALPPRWESSPAPAWEVDEKLWFVGYCGDRDYLVGNPHTHTGRMSAWCPHQEVGYSVSLYDLDQMSLEASYWARGFLSGTEPDNPYDEEGPTSDEDNVAWQQSIARFRRTGIWSGVWRTCDECGCVLFLDRENQTRCAEHPSEEDRPV